MTENQIARRVLRTGDAAQYTGLSTSTLTKLRVWEVVPQFIKLGKAVCLRLAGSRTAGSITIVASPPPLRRRAQGVAHFHLLLGAPMTIFKPIPIDRVLRGPGSVELFEDNVLALKESIGSLGQLNPITVRKVGESYQLVAGGHRLEACHQLGETQIDCIVISSKRLGSRAGDHRREPLSSRAFSSRTFTANRPP